MLSRPLSDGLEIIFGPIKSMDKREPLNGLDLPYDSMTNDPDNETILKWLKWLEQSENKYNAYVYICTYVIDCT